MSEKQAQATPTQKFDPSNHLLELRHKNKDGTTATTEYLPVKWRFAWLNTDPTIQEYEFICQESIYDPDRLVEKLDYNGKVVKSAKGAARVRVSLSILYKDGRRRTTHGTKTETALDWPDCLEKAETSACGRALAMAGYGTEFTADEFDEVTQERFVDSPVPVASSASSSPEDAKKEEVSPQPGHMKPTPQVSKPATLSSQPIVQQTNKPVPVPAKGEPSNGHKPVQQSQAQGNVAVAEQPEMKLATPFDAELRTKLKISFPETHQFLTKELFPTFGAFERWAFLGHCITLGIPQDPRTWTGAHLELMGSAFLKGWLDPQTPGGRSQWEQMKSLEDQRKTIANLTAKFGLPATLTFQRSFPRIATMLPVNMTAALADHWIDCLRCAVQDEETGVLSLPAEKEAQFADLHTVETQPEQAA